MADPSAFAVAVEEVAVVAEEKEEVAAAPESSDEDSDGSGMFGMFGDDE